MTAQRHDPGPAGAAAPAGPGALAGYLEAMEAEGTPLLGHLVLYSVFEGTVTPDQMDAWFTELGLDKKFAPGQIRPVDAFEKITGPSGIRVSYPLDPPPGASPRRRRRRDPQEREATRMIRHVHRDGDRIIRHVVREVRDGAATRLSYDARLAECVFRRDPHPSAEPGAGSLQVTADRAAITALPPREQDQVRAMLGGIGDAYARHCAYLTADRLRAVIRGYIEALSAIRVRPTGGVYFVHRAHAGTLAALRELVARFGAGSHLSRVPIPDQDEMREMIISAFTTRSREDLDKLARDIAAAQRDGASQAAITALHKRFRELQAATAEHAGLLNTSLDDTTAALKLVNAQLASLLAQAS